MDIGENPNINKKVTPDSPLKEWLVNYVGEQQSPEVEEITTGMIVETIASEFPEFLMVVAEENWVRGYHQALTDAEMGQKVLAAALAADTPDPEEQENGT